MNPDFYLCDLCGSRLDKRMRFDIVVDREMDAAGSTDDVCYTVDLCGLCLSTATAYLINKSPGFENALFLKDWIEKRKKK